MYEDQEQYDAAVARIDATPELEQYRHVLLYDWLEGAEHWAWVATAPLAEIVTWCESIVEDERLQALWDKLTEESEWDRTCLPHGEGYC